MNLFISYGHGDYPTFIERLVSDLRKEHEVWVDHELRAGDVWSFEIELAIDRCDNFIFIIGPLAVRMDSYCYKEIKYAMDHGKRIIPISLDNTLILSLPDTTDADYVDITKIQYVDMCGSVNILNEINEEEYCKQFKSLQYELCQDNGASKGEYNYHQLSDKHRPDLSQSLRNNCDKIISMNFGPTGINEAYLSQLHPKAKLEGFDDYYQTLGKLISAYSKRASEMSRDPDIRFLISGDVYMGRTSQLLYYCQKSLNDPENIKIIFYIPPFVLDHMDLFTYIYDTYLKEFPALCLTGDPQKAFRFFKDNLGTQRKIVLLIDDYDSIPKEKKKEFDRIL